MRTCFFEQCNPSDSNAYGCHGAYKINIRKGARDQGVKCRDCYQECKNYSQPDGEIPAVQSFNSNATTIVR